jgi:hypothetical protein
MNMAGRARKRGGRDGRRLEKALDEALGQTFPASDPFSVGQVTATEPPARPVDRTAPRLVGEARAPVRRRRRKRAA